MSTAASNQSRDHLHVTSTEPREEAYRPASVIKVVDLSHNVKLLRARVKDHVDSRAIHGGQPLATTPASQQFTYSAGQWLDVEIPGVPVIGGFSFVSAPNLPAELAARLQTPCPPCFDLAVRKGKHPPTAWVHSKAKAGYRILVRVGGRFTLDRVLGLSTEAAHIEGPADEQTSAHGAAGNTDVTGRGTGGSSAPASHRPASPQQLRASHVRHLLLVAGGVGINPLYSMLLELVGHVARGWERSPYYAAGMAKPPSVTLVYSCRTRSDFLFRQQLEDLHHARERLGVPIDIRVHLRETRPGTDAGGSGTGAGPTGTGIGAGVDAGTAAAGVDVSPQACEPCSSISTGSRPQTPSTATAAAAGSSSSISTAGRPDDWSAMTLHSGRVDATLLKELLVPHGEHSGDYDVSGLRIASPSGAGFAAAGRGSDAATAAGQSRGTHGQAQPSSIPQDAVAAALCGPPSMTDSVASMLLSCGLTSDDVHYEKWW